MQKKDLQKELRECPFCGGEPEMIHAVLEEYHSVDPEIICRECGYRIKAKNLAISIADSPKENCKFLDRQTSRIWNTRPAEDALKAEVERLKEALTQIGIVMLYCEDEKADEIFKLCEEKVGDSLKKAYVEKLQEDIEKMGLNYDTGERGRG